MPADLIVIQEVPPATDREVRNLCALNGLQATRRKGVWTVCDLQRLTEQNKPVVIGRTDIARSLASWVESIQAYIRTYRGNHGRRHRNR